MATETRLGVIRMGLAMVLLTAACPDRWNEVVSAQATATAILAPAQPTRTIETAAVGVLPAGWPPPNRGEWIDVELEVKALTDARLMVAADVLAAQSWTPNTGRSRENDGPGRDFRWLATVDGKVADTVEVPAGQTRMVTLSRNETFVCADGTCRDTLTVMLALISGTLAPLRANADAALIWTPESVSALKPEVRSTWPTLTVTVEQP
jgi:hypothetical protein